MGVVLTDYNSKSNDIIMNSERRVVRGGSWFDGDASNFRADGRFRDAPLSWYNNYGFRFFRS